MKITSIKWIIGCCLVGLLASPVQAETAMANGYQWEYTVSDGAAEIGLTSSAKASASGSLTIPDTINGYPVCALKAEACAGCAGLTALTLPAGIATIGSKAFKGCTGLKTLGRAANTYSIASDAFSGCGNVTSVTLPGLRELSNANSSSWPLSGTSDDYKNYSKYVYRDDKASLTAEVTGPCLVRFSWYQSSYGSQDVCSFLVDGVEIVRDSASSSTRYENVPVKAGKHKLEWRYERPATSDGSSSSYAYLTVYRLNDPSGSRKLTALLPDSYAKVTSVTFTDGTEEIPASACAGCASLTSVKYPTGLETIGSSAFSGCTALASQTIPSSVTTIGSQAFSDCTRLSTLTIQQGTTEIDSGAFSGCTALSTVTIPEGVTYVGANAFSGCTGLRKLTFGSGYKRIQSQRFPRNAEFELFVNGDGTTVIEGGAFQYSKVKRVVLRGVQYLGNKLCALTEHGAYFVSDMGNTKKHVKFDGYLGEYSFSDGAVTAEVRGHLSGGVSRIIKLG